MSSDFVIGFAGLLVNGVGLGFVAIQVRMARRAAAEGQKATLAELERTKKQATIDFYSATLDKRGEWRFVLPDDRDAVEVGRFTAEATASADSTNRKVIREYLNYLEMLAVAVATDVLDLVTIELLAGGRIIAIWDNYLPHVAAVRSQVSSPRLYSELEWLADSLRARRTAVTPVDA